MNENNTKSTKKYLIIGAILLVVIAGGFYLQYANKQAKIKKQANIQRNAQIEKQNAINNVYEQFLLKEATVGVHFEEMNTDLYKNLAYANDAVDCPEQQEFDQLVDKKMVNLSKAEVARIANLYQTCGYKSVLQKDRRWERLQTSYMELSGTLPAIEDIGNMGFTINAQHVVSYWSNIIALESIENAGSSTLADIKGELLKLLLRLENGEIVTSDLEALTKKQQLVLDDLETVDKKIIDGLAKKNDALEQVKIFKTLGL